MNWELRITFVTVDSDILQGSFKFYKIHIQKLDLK